MGEGRFPRAGTPYPNRALPQDIPALYARNRATQTELTALDAAVVKKADFGAMAILAAMTAGAPTSLTLANNSVAMRAMGDLISKGIGANSLLARAGTGDLDTMVMGANGVLMREGSNDLGSSTASGDTVLARFGGDAGWQSVGDLWKQLMTTTDVMDTSFPTGVSEPYLFYHQTFDQWFYYSDDDSGWLSQDLFRLEAKHAGNAAATHYLEIDFNAGVDYSATLGWPFPFDVKCKGFNYNCAGNSTCTIYVRDDGANVSSALASVSGARKGDANGLDVASGTIAANSEIAFAVTSGTVVSGVLAQAFFRRFET